VAAGVAELSGEVLAVALERDPLGEVAVLAQDQILAAHLAVVHLVAQPGVEALRMGLPRLVELQGDMGVHAEGEVVVDDVQGDVRLAAVHMVIGDVLVGRDLHPPAVHEHALRHPDLPQHLPDRLVRVALKENRL